jgi:hypothetical protein
MDGSLSTGALTQNSDGYQTTLNNIKDLQNLEKDLYTKLKISATTKGNDAEQTDLINRINKISQIRISLLQTLNTMSSSLQSHVGNSQVNLVDQLTLIGVIEQQLNQIKAQMNQSDNIKNNKLRMVEINTYYGKRYRSYTELMKIVIFSCILFLILALLKKKELLPENIANGLLSIVLIISLFFFLRKVNDIYWRDNMNFDQYNWFNVPDSHGKTVFEYDKEAIDGDNLADDSDLNNEFYEFTKEASSLGGCIGAKCCSKKMKYDKKKDKCVDKDEVDSFLTMAFIKSNDTTQLNSSSSDIKPFSSSNNYATI